MKARLKEGLSCNDRYGAFSFCEGMEFDNICDFNERGGIYYRQGASEWRYTAEMLDFVEEEEMEAFYIKDGGQ